ncbi:hypothetical protein ES703_121510 [subsurface metagenome]
MGLEEPASQTWLAQEPIEVIGAEGFAQSTIPCENDGFASITAELSQVGQFDKDGSILKVGAGEGWNTVPQGIQATTGHAVVTFPDGYTVPVKEEGYLYVNLTGIGKSAGMSYFKWTFIVYYTKKGH